MELKMKHLALSSLLVAGLLSGCSADNGAEDDITSKDVIRMTVKNDWQTLTRATSIYEDDNQLTPFKVYAYKHGTDAKFIDGTISVFYSSQQSVFMLVIPFKIQHTIHHVLQDLRPCQIAFLIDVPHDEDRQ